MNVGVLFGIGLCSCACGVILNLISGNFGGAVWAFNSLAATLFWCLETNRNEGKT